MANKESFRISSALKNLIGKELITDEFVAVFELVKNSFDAYAERVEIIFKDISDISKAQIIIKDDGKGMNELDLKNRWLFVAYSAKKTGEEDKDYRNKIKINRLLTGAKGVGRFSCDRLGSQLNLISIKDEINPKIQNLVINWDKLETNPLKEFININVDYQILKHTEYKLKKGTVLEIKSLRDSWNRDRILKLKKSLAKLINPNQENDSKNFQIKIIVPDEKVNDNKEKFERDKVNGFIKNEIFENLKIKTTSLTVEISKDGKKIFSTLQDRGDLIYRLTEKNPYEKTLHNINFQLFQLNQKAKYEFKKIMGIESVKYGSVFMYKNGFRIYPYGEAGEDLLLIDRRKQQGYNRFLGTRDLIGRIEVNGNQSQLYETTSRDGGLVKTDSYNDLVEFFWDYVLKRLENYVVNVIKWGDERINEETGEIVHTELWAKDVKYQILALITGFIKTENIIDIEYDKDFLNIIESKQDKSVDKIIKNISKIAAKSSNPALVKEAAKIGKVVKEVKADAERDRVKAEKEEERAKKAEEVLKYTIGQNSFLQDAIGSDTKEYQILFHNTEKSTYWIKRHIENLITKVELGATKEKLFDIIEGISLENQKIFSFTKYHKSTVFDTTVDKVNKDVVSFTNEYINNVCKYYRDYKNLNISITTPPKLSLNIRFAPIEIPIIIDNLLDNSKKAKADKIIFSWEEISSKEIKLHVLDNGNGIIKNVVDRIFDFHFTTTRGGSGLGLYHIKKVLGGMNGDIEANIKVSKGAEFIITFKK